MLLRFLQASHKMEEYCGSLIDYAKTFQIDANPVQSAFIGGFLADLRTINRKAIVFLSRSCEQSDFINSFGCPALLNTFLLNALAEHVLIRRDQKK